MHSHRTVLIILVSFTELVVDGKQLERSRYYTMLLIPDLLKDWPWALEINPSYSDRVRDEEISFICALPEVRENKVLKMIVQKALVSEQELRLQFKDLSSL